VRYHKKIMKTIQAFLLLLVFCVMGCAANLHELYLRLPEKDKELYDRSKQFMTERQQEKYLYLDNSDRRAKMIEDLHILDRLLKFPAHVRDAIMAQRVIPGMDKQAVLLSWGKPREIDRRQIDNLPTECWFFKRDDGRGSIIEKKVFFLQGVVTEVVDWE